MYKHLRTALDSILTMCLKIWLIKNFTRENILEAKRGGE